MAGSEEQLLTTNGEVTGQPLYKVRGDPHWMSTPAKARQQHASLKRAAENGFFKQTKKERK